MADETASENLLEITPPSAEQRHLHLCGATGTIRREMLNGRPHIVVPVVALMEGVISPVNAGGPEFVPLATLQKAAASWNGKPVTLGHPVRNGTQCSANSPEILEAHGIGTIANSRMDGKRLLQEAWLDEEKTKKLHPEMFNRLLESQPEEVSVGAFVITASEAGAFNGKPYGAKWLETTGDHLAFLPGKRGACSVAMGCGAHRAAEELVLHLVTAEAIEQVTDEDPRLEALGFAHHNLVRQQIQKQSGGGGKWDEDKHPREDDGKFTDGAGSGGKDEKKDEEKKDDEPKKKLSFRDRLKKFVGASETEDQELASDILQYLESKYKDCATCDGTGSKDGNPCPSCEGEGRMRAAAFDSEDELDTRWAEFNEADHPRGPDGRFIGEGAATVQARDVKPGDIVGHKYAGNPGQPKIGVVRYNHPAKARGRRIFELETGDLATGYHDKEDVHIKRGAKKLLQAGSEAPSPALKAAENTAAAQPAATLKAACRCKEHKTMTPEQKTALIKGLVENKHSGFTAGDEKFLEAADDARLEAFKVAADAREATEKELRAAAARTLTREEFMAVAPAELVTLVKRQERQEGEMKSALISELKVAQAEYSEAELSVMGVDQLQRLAKVAKVEPKIDYSGRAVPRAAAAAEDGEDFTPPNPYERDIKALQASR